MHLHSLVLNIHSFLLNVYPGIPNRAGIDMRHQPIPREQRDYEDIQLYVMSIRFKKYSYFIPVFLQLLPTYHNNRRDVMPLFFGCPSCSESTLKS